MNPALMTQRLSWGNVAKEASRRLGALYSGAYCREVATGFRKSSVLEPILRELGLMRDSTNTPKPNEASIATSEEIPQRLPGEHHKVTPFINRWGINRALLAIEMQGIRVSMLDAETFVARRIARIWSDLIAQPELKANRCFYPLLASMRYIRADEWRPAGAVFREKFLQDICAWGGAFDRLAPQGINSIEPMPMHPGVDLRAMAIAWENQVDLSLIVGSGKQGRITDRDVKAFVATNGKRDGWSLHRSPRLLRQRRILADHLRGYILSKRALEELLYEQQARHQREISELNDRLAATSEALGAEKAERILEGVARITLSERLKQEQETTSRLDSVVRRLAARPRIKRGTTHVEIGGTVYRNRTRKERSLA